MREPQEKPWWQDISDSTLHTPSQTQTPESPWIRASIAAMLKLRDTLVEQQNATNALTRRILWYTIILAIVGVLQLGLVAWQVYRAIVV